MRPLRVSALAAGLLGLALGLCSTGAGAEEPPAARRGLSLRALFSPPEGVLSPGYPDRRSGRSGPLISYASGPSSRSGQAGQAGETGSLPGGRGPRFEPAPVLALLFNPALFVFGKWSARVEVAPIKYLSVFVEGSALQVGLPSVDEKLNGSSYDVGLHLLPNGNRLNGFYMGPRYFRGRGKTSDGRFDGTFDGYGGDVGAYFVAGVFSLNLGIGIGYARVLANATDASLPIDAQSGTVKRNYVVPLATLGLGFGF